MVLFAAILGETEQTKISEGVAVFDSPADDANNSNSDSLVAEILALLAKVSEKLEPENTEMKQWMVEHFHKPVLVELLQDTTFTMLRVLDAIGQLEPVNGITISKQYKIPKGTVSKTTRRLIAKKLITRESVPDNKKEILFRLTPVGQELFQAHRAFDHQMENGFVRFLHKYNSTELSFIVRLLQDIAQTSFLDLKSE